MKKMIALRRHAYGVGNKEAGERYEATPGEAKTLVALGWAAYDAEEAPKFETKDLVAEEQAVEPATDTVPTKRTYQRRDMKAKD